MPFYRIIHHNIGDTLTATFSQPTPESDWTASVMLHEGSAKWNDDRISMQVSYARRLAIGCGATPQAAGMDVLKVLSQGEDLRTPEALRDVRALRANLKIWVDGFPPAKADQLSDELTGGAS